MKLGTHNSMSYLPPKKWYLNLFKFMAKCQNLDIFDQYKLGAKMFDIRISFDGYQPEFRHGLIAFKGDVESTLIALNSYKNVYVRLILETDEYSKKQEELFIMMCKEWEKEYTNIKFFCGRRKYDWKQLYKFKLDDIEVVQKIASMTGTKLDDLFPWLYAKFFNKRNYKDWDAKKWLLLDYIEYAVE